MKLILLPLLLFASASASAKPVLDCQMKSNPCSMTGATLTLPWSELPDPSQHPYRESHNAPFEVLSGYSQATGDYLQGTRIIRDQDAQVGAYWGFLPSQETTHFAMVSGNKNSGYRMGVKGCLQSPRVWSSSCRLTTEEELQTEQLQAAGIGPASASNSSAWSPAVTSNSAVGGPSKCFMRGEKPYMYYILELDGSSGYYSVQWYAGGGDGYKLQAFEYPNASTTLYKDQYFGLTVKVETQGNVKIVTPDFGSGGDPMICRPELDTNGLRPATEDENF